MNTKQIMHVHVCIVLFIFKLVIWNSHHSCKTVVVWPPVTSPSSDSSPGLKVRSTSRRASSPSPLALMDVDPWSVVVVAGTVSFPSAVSLPSGVGCPASGLLARLPRLLVGEAFFFGAIDAVGIDLCGFFVAGAMFVQY